MSNSKIDMWGDCVAGELEDILETFNKATEKNRQEINKVTAAAKQDIARQMVRTRFRLAMRNAKEVDSSDV